VIGLCLAHVASREAGLPFLFGEIVDLLVLNLSVVAAQFFATVISPLLAR
jgi:hypothetical protein